MKWKVQKKKSKSLVEKILQGEKKLNKENMKEDGMPFKNE